MWRSFYRNYGEKSLNEKAIGKPLTNIPSLHYLYDIDRRESSLDEIRFIEMGHMNSLCLGENEKSSKEECVINRTFECRKINDRMQRKKLLSIKQ